MNEREIFLSALEIEDPDARNAHLDEACEGDAELLARVKALLGSHEGQSEFLRTPVVEQMKRPVDGFAPTTVLDQEFQEFDEEFSTKDHNLTFLEPSTRENSIGRLAHYEVSEVIGRGAFGTVLKAFDEKLERIVAIKVLSPEMAGTSPPRKRFLREARSSALVHHDNVVGIYAVEQEPTPYLVMEYVPGKTLQQRLDEHGPLDLKDVLKIGKQIADGLAAAHAQGLIHRDIKPGNILIDDSVNDHVKITDFGLARTADDASMTQSGLIAGTPLYMAPEQVEGHRLDQRADLFSLGSVLYQMLTGRPPFRASTTMGVLKRVTQDTPRAIQEIIPETPSWMCEIVGHLHAKEPEDRFASAREVSDILGRCLADMEAGRKPKVPNPARLKPRPLSEDPQPNSRPGRFSWVKAAALALVMLAGLGVTEATNVTNVRSTVIRLLTGSGTLVIEANDPSVKISINGEEVTIRGGGIEELTLRPGEYKVHAFKDGKPIKKEFVTITRNGRTVVKMSLEPTGNKASTKTGRPNFRPDAKYPTLAPFDETKWQGTTLQAHVNGKWYHILEIDGVKVETIVAYCKQVEGDIWRKRFEEDLVQIMSLMGHPPGKTVALKVKQSQDGETKTLENVAMTEANRRALWKSRQERENEEGSTGKLNKWISLFNGKDLTGWKSHPAQPGNWRVEDGLLVSSKTPSYLFTERGDFGDFELRCEVSINRGGDGGVLIRAPFVNAGRDGLPGYETQIQSGEALATGWLTGAIGTSRAGRGWQMQQPSEIETKPDEWITLTIRAIGNRIETFVDQEKAAEFKDVDRLYDKGRIALQQSGPSTQLKFRKIEFREIEPKRIQRFSDGEWIDVIPLIDPELDKWNLPWTGKNDWRIDAGELIVGFADQKQNKLVLPLDSDWSAFECEIEVTRRSGDSGFILNLPKTIGETPLAFDPPGLLGLGLGKRGQTRVLSVLAQLETGKRTAFRVEVRREENGDRLAVWRNDQRIANWTGNRNELPGYENEGFPHHRRLSLFTFPGGSELVFHKIRVRMLDGGTAETIRPLSMETRFQWPANAPPFAVAPFNAEQAMQHQEAWAKYLGVPVEYENSLGMTFRLIPPGEFLMGSTDEQVAAAVAAAQGVFGSTRHNEWVEGAERPQHRVVLTRPYLMSETEVTIGQFRRFAADTNYRTTLEQKNASQPLSKTDPLTKSTAKPPVSYRNPGHDVNDNFPAQYLSWNDATAFCEWLSKKEGDNYRLPTEAEWEYACRAGTATQFSFGDDPQSMDRYGWHLGNSKSPQQVATRLPNPFGLFDMHGNVYEFCSDVFDAKWYERSPTSDPKGPNVGGQHTIRGGWSQFAINSRSAYRSPLAANWTYALGGIRVVKEIDRQAAGSEATPFRPAVAE